MSEFNWSAWQQDETKAVTLDGGRVARVRSIGAIRLLDLLGLPIGSIVNGSGSDDMGEAIQASMAEMKASDISNLMRDVVIAGTVAPRIVRDASEVVEGESIAYDHVGESRALTLFTEIMSMTNLGTEDAAQAADFRQE